MNGTYDDSAPTQVSSIHDIYRPESAASEFAGMLVLSLLEQGVTDIVVAPGSRSQALALAAAEAERLRLVNLHVRIDERSAAFLALGLSRETGQPTVILTTSGTAVANLHPAVLEAHHDGVPLILLTADRPQEMRGIRLNQTTTQNGIFGKTLRYEEDVPAPTQAIVEATLARQLAVRAVAAARGDALPGGRPSYPGPVQLNLQFREPLSGTSTVQFPQQLILPPRSKIFIEESVLTLKRGPTTVVVAGAGAGARAEEFAREAGWPLFAEVCSGARFGPNLIAAYPTLLGEEELQKQIERVIVFGHPTLNRDIPALIQREGVETIVVATSGVEWYNPGHRVRRFERAVRVADSSELSQREYEWLGMWVTMSREVMACYEPSKLPRSGVDETGHVTDYATQREFTRKQLQSLRTPVSREELVRSVWAATWPHDRLMFGASRLIRVADRVAPGRQILVHANRGLSGIDGTIATAIGVATASQRRTDHSGVGVTRALIGDLTFLHDVGSLYWGAEESRPRVQIIVGNDGGGSIFDDFDPAGQVPPPLFDRVMFTPQRVKFAALAEAYGWAYQHVNTRLDLDEALACPPVRPTVVEVTLLR